MALLAKRAEGEGPQGLCPRGSAGRAELTPAVDAHMDDPFMGRTDWERQAAKNRVRRGKRLTFMFG